jgi:hypothetical protein
MEMAVDGVRVILAGAKFLLPMQEARLLAAII